MQPDELKDLKFKSEQDFIKWCQKRGFDSNNLTRKSKKRLIQKRKHELDLIAQQEKYNKKPWTTLAHNIRVNGASYDLLEDMIKYLYKLHIKFLCDRQYLRGLGVLTKYSLVWIRQYTDWKPKTHNMHAQFSDFLNFLLCEYRGPEFLEPAFYKDLNERELEKYRSLFVQIGCGESPKKIARFKNMTKRQIHYWINTPINYAMHEADLYSQVMATGGNERLVKTLLRTQFEHLNKKQSVIDFFVRNPLLDHAEIGPIIDYLLSRQDEGGFSMKGRSAMALLEQTQEWHRQVNKIKRKTLGCSYWAASGYQSFMHTIGREKEKRIYRITELTTVSELKEEGRELHHCIATYARNCQSGAYCIWSLNVQTVSGNIKKLVTILVNKSTRQIIEARGKYNALPSPQERGLIYQWSTKTALSMRI